MHTDIFALYICLNYSWQKKIILLEYIVGLTCHCRLINNRFVNITTRYFYFLLICFIYLFSWLIALYVIDWLHMSHTTFLLLLFGFFPRVRLLYSTTFFSHSFYLILFLMYNVLRRITLTILKIFVKYLPFDHAWVTLFFKYKMNFRNTRGFIVILGLTFLSRLHYFTY